MRKFFIAYFEAFCFLLISGLVLAGTSISHADEPGKYDWPTPGPAPILKGFENPPKPWMKGHRGVDLELAVGQPVRSAGDGQVCYVGTVAGKPVVSICHTQLLRTTYEPVEASVKTGQWVRRGQEIGVLGTYPPPYPSMPGLHWGAKVQDGYINPLSLLRGTVRLKPWEGLTNRVS